MGPYNRQSQHLPDTVMFQLIPIDYYTKGKTALHEYNKKKHNGHEPLDIRILRELHNSQQGYPAGQLRRDCQPHKLIFTAVFNRSINRLLALEYITRIPRSKYVYYYITVKGRNALYEMNDILVKLVEDRLNKSNP